MTDLVTLEETRKAHDALPDIIWRATLQRLGGCRKTVRR
jgi:hypothetical protein